jgi:hypothetical protein
MSQRRSSYNNRRFRICDDRLMLGGSSNTYYSLPVSTTPTSSLSPDAADVNDAAWSPAASGDQSHVTIMPVGHATEAGNSIDDVTAAFAAVVDKNSCSGNDVGRESQPPGAARVAGRDVIMANDGGPARDAMKSDKSAEFWNARLDQLLTVQDRTTDDDGEVDGLTVQVGQFRGQQVCCSLSEDAIVEVVSGFDSMPLGDCSRSSTKTTDVIDVQVTSGATPSRDAVAVVISDSSCDAMESNRPIALCPSTPTFTGDYRKGMPPCTDPYEAQCILTTRYKLGEINMKRSKSLITWSRWNIAHIIRGPHDLSPVWKVDQNQTFKTDVAAVSNEITRRQTAINELVRSVQQSTGRLHIAGSSCTLTSSNSNVEIGAAAGTSRVVHCHSRRPASTLWQTELAVWIRTQHEHCSPLASRHHHRQLPSCSVRDHRSSLQLQLHPSSTYSGSPIVSKTISAAAATGSMEHDQQKRNKQFAMTTDSSALTVVANSPVKHESTNYSFFRRLTTAFRTKFFS